MFDKNHRIIFRFSLVNGYVLYLYKSGKVFDLKHRMNFRPQALPDDPALPPFQVCICRL